MDYLRKNKLEINDDLSHRIELNLEEYPIKDVLDILLEDKTTGNNIIWATNSYQEKGPIYSDQYEITKEAIFGENKILIQPRVFKHLDEQKGRTKVRGEVFSPSWIVNKMINTVDADWFKKENVFNQEEGQNWKTTEEEIPFHKKSEANQYIERTVLEIACGEAPFLTSRYDAVTGQKIPLNNRVGLLDRKLRVVQENATDKNWISKAKKAYKTTYGYEFQGDNLLIARINLLLTFVENYEDKFKRSPDQKVLKEFAEIIAWNVFQMDGLNYCVPLGVPKLIQEQISLFNMVNPKEHSPLCRIRNWSNSKESIVIQQLGEKDNNMAKFDFVIGNPPYQEYSKDNGRQPPVYHKFYDEAAKIGDLVEFITPGRFLFNAGQTPKEWNRKLLNSENFSVLMYEPDSNKIFPTLENTIKGGIAISSIDKNRKKTPIRVFSSYSEMNSILNKVMTELNSGFLNEICGSTGLYRFNTEFFEKCQFLNKSSGTGRKITSKVMEESPEIFKNKENPKDLKILGRINKKRAWRYVSKDAIENNAFLSTFNVAIPKANGTGIFGEKLSSPEILYPNEITADSYMCIGTFQSINEACALEKYIKTKFLRALLSVRKVTQDNPKGVWMSIPIQDFTNSSEIDWSVSIAEIDQQLYRKYGLSSDEINFIEERVQVME